MKPSEDLFLLIKSLTKTEKRYFKRFCKLYSTNKKNNYLKLFDAIDKQKVYDEKKIKEKFRNEKFVKQLSVLKDYLNKIILKSLRDYSENIKVSKIMNNVIDGIILDGKGLKKMSYDSFKKAYAASEVLERNDLKLVILNYQKKLVKFVNMSNPIRELDLMHEDEKKALLKVRSDSHYSWLYFQIILNGIYKDFFAVKPQYKKDLAEFYKKNIKNLQDDDSFYTKYYYFASKYEYSRLINDSEKKEKWLSCIISCFETNKDMMQQNAEIYLRTLGELILLQVTYFRYKESKENMIKYKRFVHHMKLGKIREFTGNMIELYMMQVFGEMGGINVILNNAVYLLEKYCKEFPANRITHTYTIATSYFYNNQFEESLMWFNKILKNQNVDSRSDIYRITRLLQLVIHYELNNYSLLEYVVKQADRYFIKSKPKFKTEKIVLNFFKKIVMHKEIYNKEFLWDKLKKDLRVHRWDENEKIIFYYFNFISWIESKIEKTPIAKILKEKAAKMISGESSLFKYC